ncbi:hypothetical protein QZM44_11945 [Burkholderia seminalis]|nr:hypothetical protein [Burkholderia seminalis]MDN7587612.1 hypothetical protein [Burkholderia seminalis]
MPASIGEHERQTLEVGGLCGAPRTRIECAARGGDRLPHDALVRFRHARDHVTVAGFTTSGWRPDAASLHSAPVTSLRLREKRARRVEQRKVPLASMPTFP